MSKTTRVSAPDWQIAKRADGDGNGEITIADITPLGANLLGQVAGYRVLGAVDAEAEFEEIGFLAVTKELLTTSTVLTYIVPDGPWTAFTIEPLDAAELQGRAQSVRRGIVLDQFPGSGDSGHVSLPQILFPTVPYNVL